MTSTPDETLARSLFPRLLAFATMDATAISIAAFYCALHLPSAVLPEMLLATSAGLIFAFLSGVPPKPTHAATISTSQRIEVFAVAWMERIATTPAAANGAVVRDMVLGKR